VILPVRTFMSPGWGAGVCVGGEINENARRMGSHIEVLQTKQGVNHKERVGDMESQRCRGTQLHDANAIHSGECDKGMR
jgi:hypothetical protein